MINGNENEAENEPRHGHKYTKYKMSQYNDRYMYQATVKACVRYFHQISIFSPNDSTLKTGKSFLFHLKSSFRSPNT